MDEWGDMENTDGDNLPDAIEALVPGRPGPDGTIVPGDGNGDGIPDSQQANVMSLPLFLSDQNIPWLTMIMDGPIPLIQLTPNSDTANPGDLNLPVGLFNFHFEGWSSPAAAAATATRAQQPAGPALRIYIGPDIGIDGFYAYNNETGGWDNIAADLSEMAFGTRIQIDLEDGGPHDQDGLVNGAADVIGAPGHSGDMARMMLPFNNGFSLFERLSLFGHQGDEWVRLQGGYDSWLDQNIDGVELPGALNDYSFAQLGNTVSIEGPVQRASLVVQGPPTGTALVTDEGGTRLHFEDHQLLLGNQPLSTKPEHFEASALGDSFDPSATASDEPFSHNISPNRLLLEPYAHVHLAEAAEVYGQAGGIEGVSLVGTPGVEVDQNIERVLFDGELSEYRFRQQGNSLNVRRDDTWVATIYAQSDDNGTELIFTDYSVQLHYQASHLRLDNAQVPDDAWGTIGTQDL
jgi:hypothetical protein